MSGSATADIRDTYGIGLIGLVVEAVLYGVTITQIWIYYWSSHCRERDPMMLKGFIAILFALDTLHMILIVYSIYWYLILNFGNVENLDIDMWAFDVQIDINGLVGYMVQIFYARRVYIMSKSIIIPLIVVILGGLCFALGFVWTVRALQIRLLSDTGSLTWVTCVGMSSTAIADILIALAMCWYLYHKRTGFSRTDTLINTLMFYSVNSGLLTSVLATGMFVSFLAWQDGFLFVILYWLMGKCYVNSFLAMLNSRDALRERSANEGSSNVFHMQRSNTPYQGKTGPAAVPVTVLGTASMNFATSEHDYQDTEIEKSGISIPSAHDDKPESCV